MFDLIKKLTAAFLIYLLGGFPTLVFALPEDGQIAAGSGNIQQPDANNMVINQSSAQIITNWKGFSIGAAETVQFNQPDANSVALNRVIGQDPSVILGRLSANGQIFLTNPSGVIFGQGARVDVGGILATTLKISDQDFLNRNYIFKQDESKSLASILNEGKIMASDGGYVGLLAPTVENKGTITAHLGSVALASGKEAVLDFSGNGLINFAIANDDSQSSIINSGTIKSDGGQVILSARAAKNVIRSVVNNTGIIEAKSVIQKNGRIFLMGDDVDNSGTLDTTVKETGAQPGSIELQGDVVSHSGSISSGGGDVEMKAKTSVTIDGPITTNGGDFFAGPMPMDEEQVVAYAHISGSTISVPIHISGSSFSSDNCQLSTANCQPVNPKITINSSITTSGGNVTLGRDSVTTSSIGAGTLSQSLSPSAITITNGAIITNGGNLYINGEVTLVNGDLTISAGTNGVVTLSEAVNISGNRLSVLSSGITTIDANSSIFGTTGWVDIAASDLISVEGDIIFSDAGTIELTGGAITVADGTSIMTPGGSIILEGSDGEIVSVSGTLDASDSASGQAGGTVHVLGDLVGLFGSSVINVSGDAGGGTALIGGDFQGKNTAIRNANRTFVGSGVNISADALASGNGGKVIVWADDITRYNGAISATGGAVSGDGGFVEVSGKKYLDFNGTVNTLAANGVNGMLLLDPDFLTIVNAGAEVSLAGTNGDDSNAQIYAFAENQDGTDTTMDASVVVTALTGGSVILQAHTDITVNEAITSGTANSGLTLQAGDDIIINQNITLTGTGALTLQAGNVAGGATPVGKDGNGDITVASGVTLTTATGDISMDSEAAGVITLAGTTPIVTAGGAVNFSKAVTLNTAASTISTGAGTGNISFSSTVDGA